MAFIRFCIILLLASSFTSTKNAQHFISVNNTTDTIPSMLLGNFKDDYSIEYTLTDTLFTQHPNVRYHIIKWNVRDQYFIAKNDLGNPSEQDLYSRIDYMQFENMEPFKWGFCLTVYNATSDSLAEVTAVADRKNPKKGCGGYPFSRMKRLAE